VVGPNQTFITTASTDGTNPIKVGSSTAFTGYLGLQFDIAVNNGCISCTTELDPYGYATVVNDVLVSITYDNTGASVTIPAPEPASLGLLAFGAAGIAALRRRRRQPSA
jgi:hypothetical protein